MRSFWKVFEVSLLSVAVCLGTFQLLEGYEHPLTVSAIHEAYVLGVRNDQATAHFLSPYILQCSAPPQSCFATEVEVITPFAQVVELSHRNATSGYTEQQAAEDIRQRGDVIIVQITLMLPAAYAEAAQNKIGIVSRLVMLTPLHFAQRTSGKSSISLSNNMEKLSPRVPSIVSLFTRLLRRTCLPCWTEPQYGLSTMQRMWVRRKRRWRSSRQSPRNSASPSI